MSQNRVVPMLTGNKKQSPINQLKTCIRLSNMVKSRSLVKYTWVIFWRQCACISAQPRLLAHSPQSTIVFCINSSLVLSFYSAFSFSLSTQSFVIKRASCFSVTLKQTIWKGWFDFFQRNQKAKVKLVKPHQPALHVM